MENHRHFNIQNIYGINGILIIKAPQNAFNSFLFWSITRIGGGGKQEIKLYI